MIKNILKKTIVSILTLEARLVLLKYRPHIIGITGSVGKSSTKDAIFTALASSVYVRKSQKSFNSELGVPLTILGCDTAWNNPLLWLKNILVGLGVILLPNHYPRWLVLEVGLDRPGDIARIVRWLKLDVVVYTRLSQQPVHVEFFESVEALLNEKKKLLDGLKSDGLLITNRDDALQNNFKRESCTRISYAIENPAIVQGTHITTIYSGNTPRGTAVRIEHGGASIPLELRGVLGHQHVYPILAGYAVAAGLELNLVAVGEQFGKHTYLPGRMNVLVGKSGVTIIDDSYNASPVATRAALNVLDEIETEGRKVAILGDMTELGKLTVPAHKNVGEQVARIADVFIAVGQRMETAVVAAQESGMDSGNIHTFHSATEAKEVVKDLLQPRDVVLVKGSQAMRMERVVETLLARPQRARELLVRQGKEWQKR